MTRRTGVATSARSSRMSASPLPAGASASTRKRMTSTSLMDARASSTMYLLSIDLARWIPGVSMNTIWAPGMLWIPLIRLRVVWGLSEVMTIFSPRMLFRRLDFPALGRPMIDTNPERNGSAGIGCVLSWVVQVEQTADQFNMCALHPQLQGGEAGVGLDGGDLDLPLPAKPQNVGASLPRQVGKPRRSAEERDRMPGRETSGE